MERMSGRLYEKRKGTRTQQALLELLAQKYRLLLMYQRLSVCARRSGGIAFSRLLDGFVRSCGLEAAALYSLCACRDARTAKLCAGGLPLAPWHITDAVPACAEAESISAADSERLAALAEDEGFFAVAAAARLAALPANCRASALHKLGAKLRSGVRLAALKPEGELCKKQCGVSECPMKEARKRRKEDRYGQVQGL